MAKKKKAKDTDIGPDEMLEEIADIDEDSDHPVHIKYTKEKKHLR